MKRAWCVGARWWGVLAVAALFSAREGAAADSFKDWMQQEQNEWKDFKEGKDKPAKQPGRSGTNAAARPPEPRLTPRPGTPDVMPAAPAAEPEATKAGAGTAEWLVMAYMAGDNNLDPFTLADVEEMQEIGSSDQLKIVVLMDRVNYGDWTTTRRMLVRKPSDQGGKNSWDPSLPTCEDLGEKNMGDPATLRDFVVWARGQYPAKREMLVLWNHGGGWRSVVSRAMNLNSRGAGDETTPALGLLSRGICWDDTNNGDFLESREVRAALQSMPKLSILGCDACLMGMIECAYEWRDAADYFIASEESEPGDGWPYTPILRKLALNPTTPPKDLAACVVNAYADSYRTEPTTQAATDLSKIAPLVSSMDELSSQLLKFTQNGGWVAGLMSGLPGYPKSSVEFVDLDSLLEKIAGTEAFGSEVRQAAGKARRCFADAVIANRSSPVLGGRGLSIYPGGGPQHADYNGNIIQFARDTHWDEFLNAWGAVRAQKEASRLAPAETAKPERWAVLIGVADYNDPQIPDLKYSVEDVVRVRDALISSNGYDPTHVIVLTNAAATTENVRSTLGTLLPRKAKEQDMVMIYFSGHGGAEPAAQTDIEDGTEKYVLLANTKLDDFYGTALPMSELARIFARIRADKLLFIIDACYSGAVGGKGVSRSGMRSIGLTDEYMERLTGSKGTVVITASRASEVSVESPVLKHGVFTYNLLDVLNGKADTDTNGVTTILEGFQYLMSHVSAEAKKMGASQHPVMKGEITGEFPMAWSKGAATP